MEKKKEQKTTVGSRDVSTEHHASDVPPRASRLCKRVEVFPGSNGR